MSQKSKKYIKNELNLFDIETIITIVKNYDFGSGLNNQYEHQLLKKLFKMRDKLK